MNIPVPHPVMSLSGEEASLLTLLLLLLLADASLCGKLPPLYCNYINFMLAQRHPKS